MNAAALDRPPPGLPPAALEGLSQSLLDEAQIGLFIHQDGFVRFANPYLADLVGRPVDALIGSRSIEMVVADDRPVVEEQVRRRNAGASGIAYEVRFRRADAEPVEARVCGRRIAYDGRPADLVTVLDITALKQALHRVEWHAGMLARTEALCRTGSFEVELPAGRVLLSSGLTELIGGTADVEAQIDALGWVPAGEREQVAGIWRHATPDEPFEFQHRIECADGRRLVVVHRGILRRDADGHASHGIAILQDITAQREAEHRIQQLAHQDEVTGLPNRAALLDGIDAAIHAARWDAVGFALLAIDVPHIDQVKSTMGYGAGDTLAMAMASRLLRLRQEGEMLARLAGGEFAMLLDPADCVDGEAVLARAHAVQAALQVPERLGSAEVLPQPLIGIARHPDDGETPATLLESAQTARLGARTAFDAGRAAIAFFEPLGNAVAVRALALEAALRQAAERGELTLHYQPQVDLATGQICGVEALLRWTSPEFGSVSPAEFIPLAERSGLILPIGDWVLERACEQSVAWQRAGLPGFRMGVNLSPRQLQCGDIAERVQATLLRTGADPGCLGIEITESMVMADTEQAARALSELKALGIEISLDDFGTGFSSLACLRSLPIDIVKIDRSFVKDVTTVPAQASVTRAVVTMAHSLQMRVLAEGVETEGQLDLLVAYGCDQIQGYFFSRPLPADALEALLRADKRLPEHCLVDSRRRRTLLIVDDEPPLCEAMVRLFRRDGYRLLTAGSADDALERLRTVEVDMVIADQRMPGDSGLELLRTIATLQPNTRRLLMAGHLAGTMSGYRELQAIIDATNDGAIHGFLAKPCSDERLRACVAEGLRDKEMADDNRRLARELQRAEAELDALRLKRA